MIQFYGFPTLDVNNGILRAWWIEPLVATLSFAIAVNAYWCSERMRGLSRNNHLIDTIGVGSMGDLYNSLAAYWIGIIVLKTFSPPSEMPDGVPYDTLGVLHLIGEVVAGIFMYDAAFFVVHMLMHEIPWLRGLHRRHHYDVKYTLEARDVLRHSLLDGALQVICNIIVQQQNPWGTTKSRLGRVLHNVIVTWMLTESHTASPEPYIWRRWCIGVREHRLHHLGMHQHESYQQFFGYLDHLRLNYGHTGPKSSKLDVFNDNN